MTRRPFMPTRTLIAAFGLLLAAPSVALAVPTPAELEKMEQTRAVAEAEAGRIVELTFSRLCPGRCELIDVTADVATPKPVAAVTPGFDSAVSSAAFDVELKGVDVRVMIDSSLPNTFRSQLPQILKFRLERVSKNARITPSFLEFPKPQFEPSPELPPEPPKAEEPKPEPPPEPPPEPEEPKPEVEPEPEEKPETPWYEELWAELLPWIPYALMMGIIVACAVVLLNKLRELLDLQRQAIARMAPEGDDADASRMPDADELRQELKASRSVQNEVLRRWVGDDPSSVALLVRMVGADILDDLRRDAGLRPALEEISAEVAAQDEPLGPREAQRIARATRARLTAARVLTEQAGGAGDWEFTQGLSVANAQRVLSTLAPAEKSYAIGQLPSGVRAAYLEQMNPNERRELFLNAGAGDTLSREQALDLSARLRRATEEVSHIGSEADGQAAIVTEMLRALPVDEQVDTLRAMRQRRPEIAQAVFSTTLLEPALTHAPPEALADAMQRTPVDTLTRFLRGASDPVRDHLVDLAPASIRGPLLSELELEIPVGRADYIDARTEVLDNVLSVLRRDGIDPATVNARALSGGAQAQQA